MKPFTEKHKSNISKAKKGKPGHKHTEEFKRMVGNIHRGKIVSKETRDKISKSRIGMRYPDEVNKKKGSRGSKNGNWKGGITPILRSIRTSTEYKLWRKSVFERDKYICVFCGKIGGNINADHIKRFIDYPELRFAIDNGRTLCTPCHIKTDTYGNKTRR